MGGKRDGSMDRVAQGKRVGVGRRPTSQKPCTTREGSLGDKHRISN